MRHTIQFSIPRAIDSILFDRVPMRVAIDAMVADMGNALQSAPVCMDGARIGTVYLRRLRIPAMGWSVRVQDESGAVAVGRFDPSNQTATFVEDNYFKIQASPDLHETVSIAFGTRSPFRRMESDGLRAMPCQNGDVFHVALQTPVKGSPGAFRLLDYDSDTAFATIGDCKAVCDEINSANGWTDVKSTNLAIVK
jgi:hypothetical protein